MFLNSLRVNLNSLWRCKDGMLYHANTYLHWFQNVLPKNVSKNICLSMKHLESVLVISWSKTLIFCNLLTKIYSLFTNTTFFFFIFQIIMSVTATLVIMGPLATICSTNTRVVVLLAGKGTGVMKVSTSLQLYSIQLMLCKIDFISFDCCLFTKISISYTKLYGSLSLKVWIYMIYWWKQ